MSPSGQFTTSGTLTFDRTAEGDPAAAAAAIISEGSAQSEVFTSTAGSSHPHILQGYGSGCSTHPFSSSSSSSSAVLTALPALAVSPQPVHAKMSGVASPSNGLESSLEVGPVGGSAPVVSEAQKNIWFYLEELANTLLSNIQQLKALIEQAKNTSGDTAGVRGHGGRKEVRGEKSARIYTKAVNAYI